MSNFLQGFGRTVGLTDDTGDDNISRAGSYVEVNFLQGANTHGCAPRDAEGDGGRIPLGQYQGQPHRGVNPHGRDLAGPR
jgi:hypothetical protein